MQLPGYPFTPKRLDVRPGVSMSYLDEGPREGEVVVMVHGNPSWSYYWRNLVTELAAPRLGKAYRCIVPDHIGMGLSDKPDDGGGLRHPHGRVDANGRPPAYDYTLAWRVQDLQALLRHAGIDDATPVTLAVLDWGGMIGFGWALTHAAQVKRLVITNTAAFPLPAAKAMPWQIALGRDSLFGSFIIRAFNAFSSGASYVGIENKLPAEVRRAYVAPYDSWAHRISTVRFMQDIPLSPADHAWPMLEAAGKALPTFADRPAFIGWGLKDFVFDKHFLEGFRRALPHAQVSAFEDAGHYVLEDKAQVLVPQIRAFLDAHPL